MGVKWGEIVPTSLAGMAILHTSMGRGPAVYREITQGSTIWGGR